MELSGPNAEQTSVCNLSLHLAAPHASGTKPRRKHVSLTAPSEASSPGSSQEPDGCSSGTDK